MTRAQRLDLFFERQMAVPGQWGVADCTTMPADWVALETSIDPAAPYRGAYHDEESCMALIARHGGLETMIAARMAGCGFESVTAPQLGDVGLIAVPRFVLGRRAHVAVVAAIRSRGMWMVRAMQGAGGLCLIDAALVAAWRV